MRAARFVGHYVNVLATASVLGMIVSPILLDSLHIDLGFILAFWIGVSLLNGRPWSRKVTLTFSTLGILVALGYLVMVLWAKGPVSGAHGALRSPLLASIHGGVLLLLFLPPWVLLLLPETRRWFVEQRYGPPARSPVTRRTIALYAFAACVPVAAGVALELSTRTIKSSSFCTGFTYGDRKTGIVAAGWMEDELTGRSLGINWLAFAESDSYGSPRDGHVTFGPHRVAVPEPKPVRYIFSPPSLEAPVDNVLLVRQDGTVIRLARRVTPEQLQSAQDAAKDSRDFDQLRERLESLLSRAVTKRK